MSIISRTEHKNAGEGEERDEKISVGISRFCPD